jgi:aspartyl-tRNA synthetase
VYRVKTEGIHNNITNGASGNSNHPSGKATITKVINGNAATTASPSGRDAMNRERPARSTQNAETKEADTMTRTKGQKRAQKDLPYLAKLYRPYSMNMSRRWIHEERILFKDIDFTSKYLLMALLLEANVHRDGRQYH